LSVFEDRCCENQEYDFKLCYVRIAEEQKWTNCKHKCSQQKFSPCSSAVTGFFRSLEYGFYVGRKNIKNSDDIVIYNQI